MSGLTIHPEGVQFKPDTDIPDLTGRNIFVTGGTGGIGRTAILSFANHNPGHIVFTGRNAKRACQVMAEARNVSPDLRITFMECDQSSLQSVEATAKDFVSKFDKLDILFANAGIMATPPSLTKDGYELQFGTNHMGHALLLKHLLPLMANTASTGRDVRIITTASSAFQGASKVAYDTIKTPQNMFFGHWRRYMQSKLANLWYAQKIAELYPNIISCAIQPGAVDTGIAGPNLGMLDKLFIALSARSKPLTPEEGAYNMLWVATAPRGSVKSGTYYEPVGWPGTLTEAAQDRAARDELWQWTQKELEGYHV